MNLLAVTINHHTAPVGLREALHLSNDEISVLIKQLKGEVLSEGLVISTCNRTELYGVPLNKELSPSDFQKFLVQCKSVNGVEPSHFNNLISRSAIHHLFDVVTGIDSLLIGDNQIFKQVKDSFQISEDHGFSGFLMKRIFDSALKAGKRAISETEISEGAVTVSYAAVQLIEKIFSNLSKKSALVIGAGETGEIAAKHLVEKGIGRLSITNRTYEKAEKIAGHLDAGIIPFGSFKNHMHEYDIILSATSAENILITKDDIKKVMKKRNYSSLVLMDIAIPRDIDPACKEIDYVFSHDIDSLNIIVDQNIQKRKSEIPKVKQIIEEELNIFYNWYNSLEAAPTIKSLRELFEAIRAEEVEKNKNRFSAEDREKLDVVTKRIINKILHHPTVELKKLAEPENGAGSYGKISIIRDLFGIDKNEQKEEDS